MLTFLPRPLLAAIMFVLFVTNLVLWSTPVYVLILVKLVLPKGRLRDRVSVLASDLAQMWASVNHHVGDFVLGTQWELRGLEELDRKGQYLVLSNHQTWNDIYVLMKAFDRRAPFFKFFLKKELIWVPILGLVWWGLDYPFMQRSTPEEIEKNPSLRGKDLETTRRACEKYQNQPVLILNFLEGTRFTKAKHDRQQSPYGHLLRPKSGGFAFTLSAMGEKLGALLDVTIVYPGGAVGFWDFLAGRMRKVIVEVRTLAVPKEFLRGDYQGDPVFRKRVQDWVGNLWAEKDRRIGDLLAGAA